MRLRPGGRPCKHIIEKWNVSNWSIRWRNWNGHSRWKSFIMRLNLWNVGPPWQLGCWSVCKKTHVHSVFITSFIWTRLKFCDVGPPWQISWSTVGQNTHVDSLLITSSYRTALLPGDLFCRNLAGLICVDTACSMMQDVLIWVSWIAPFSLQWLTLQRKCPPYYIQCLQHILDGILQECENRINTCIRSHQKGGVLSTHRVKYLDICT